VSPLRAWPEAFDTFIHAAGCGRDICRLPAILVAREYFTIAMLFIFLIEFFVAATIIKAFIPPSERPRAQ